MRLRLAAGHLDDDTFNRTALLSLTGKAAEWMARRCNVNDLPPFDVWSAHLRDYFQGAAIAEDTARLALSKLKQRGSLHQYVSEFEALADNIDMTDSSRRWQFVQGLKPTLQIEINKSEPRSYSETVRLAARLCNVIIDSNATPIASTQQSPQKMEIDEVEIDYVRTNQARRPTFSSGNGDGQQQRFRNNGNARASYAASPSACYNCGRTNHLSYQCQRRCQLCNNSDNHIRADCPHARRNTRRAGNVTAQ